MIVEALAAGIAVVATDCPSGPAEILMNGRFGILVRPGDAASVAEGLEQSLSGKGASSPAERRARAMEFSDDAALDRYAALIRALQRDGAR